MNSMSSYVYNIAGKIVFFVAFILQVILWPTSWTISFAGIVALEGIITYFTTPSDQMISKISGKGLFIMHGGDKTSLRQYILSAFVGIYTCFYFVGYVSQEIDYLPRMTSWIPPPNLKQYIPGKPLPNMDVIDEASIKMRKNTFVWPRIHEDNGVVLNGTIHEGKPLIQQNNEFQLQSLACQPENSNSKFVCHATNLATFQTPSDYYQGQLKHSFVPMSSQFYVTDIKITPKQNIMKCEDLEFYRIILNSDVQTIYALDYPASTLPEPSSSNPSSVLHCGLFNEPTWCLRYEHSFSPVQYKEKIKQKCVEGDGSIIFRLPVRTIDINPKDAKLELDVLIVSKYADVRVKHTWHDNSDNLPNVIRSLQQWHTVDGDVANEWRNSTQDFQVFIKFAISIIPFLMSWYFLATEFENLVPDHFQVLVMCIFILFPAIILFLSVGAWLPMAGCIICAIAINHPPPVRNINSLWKRAFRPTLFFIFAICNSIQFCWLVVLIYQADISAFYYEYSLKQMSDMTQNFIISSNSSPSWMALILPTVLSLNLAFFIGSVICFIFEVIAQYSSNASQ